MLFHTSLAAAASTDRVGPSIALVVLVLGVIKTISLMFRPQVSRLCVSSLLLFLTAWALGTAGGLAGAAYPDFPTLPVITGVVMVLMMLASLALGIAGLLVWKHAGGRYVQGRNQAVWGVVLSGIVVVIAGSAAVLGILKSNGISASGNSLEPGFAGSQDFEKYNFQLGQPQRPWVKMGSSKLAPDAVVMYSRGRPESYFSVVVEENPSNLTREDLRDLTLDRIKGLADSTEVLKAESAQRTGLTFEVTGIKASGMNGSGKLLYFEFWQAASDTKLYQLTFWSQYQDRNALERSAVSWMETFRLLTPERDTGEPEPFPDRAVPEDGFASSLADLGWSQDAETEYEEAVVGARKGNHHLALVPLPLPPGAKVRPADLDRVLLSSLNPAHGELPENPEEISHGEIKGREYAFDRKLDEVTFRFEARILRQNSMAWLLVTWGLKNESAGERQQAAAAVSLSVPASGTESKTPEWPARVIKARSYFLNDLGIENYKRQEYGESGILFRAALTLQPEDPGITFNVVDAEEQNGRPLEALRFLKEEAAPVLRESERGQSRIALLEASAGENATASAIWESLFAKGYENEDHLLAWINLLLALEKPERAVKAVDEFAVHHPSARLERWKASVLARNDQYDEALALLDSLISRSPADVEALYLKGELANEAGRYELAAATSTKLVEADEDTARTWMILGWSEWNRRAFKEARQAFSKAAAKSPENTTIQEALTMTNGALGQGTAGVSQKPLEPVLVPAALRKALEESREVPMELIRGSAAYYKERLIGVHYEAGKPVRVSHHYNVKVLDSAGVEEFSTVTVDFHPAYEQIHVNRLVVRDEEGKIVQEGTNADAYTAGESGELATGTQVLHVPVPGLRRGGSFEAVITVEDKAKSTTPPFRRDWLASGFPAIARGLFVTGDTGTLRYDTSANMVRVEADGVQGFLAFDVPAYRREPYMAPLEEWQPWVACGPADGDWRKLAGDYLKRISDRLEPDESTSGVAETICQGLTTREEKLGAIIRHVQTSLTYKGIEFGSRGNVPSPVRKIQSDQYGDCKDHTVLLYHLLRHAGIASFPVLVDTGWKVRRDIPSLDQFDHMILQVPDVGNQPWIDATEDWLDLTKFVPGNLAGCEALVLDPAGARFERIPEPAPAGVRIDRHIVLSAGTPPTVEETLILSGAAAAWGRTWFLSAARSETANLVRRQLNPYAALDLQEVVLEHAEDQSRPLEVRLKYQLPQALRAGAAQLALPMFWEQDYLSMNPVGTRRSPIHVSPALTVESRTRLTGGARTADPAPTGEVAKGSLPDGSWLFVYQEEEGDPVLAFRADLRSGDYPVTDWPAFVHGRQTLMELLKNQSFTPP